MTFVLGASGCLLNVAIFVAYILVLMFAKVNLIALIILTSLGLGLSSLGFSIPGLFFAFKKTTDKPIKYTAKTITGIILNILLLLVAIFTLGNMLLALFSSLAG